MALRNITPPEPSPIEADCSERRLVREQGRWRAYSYDALMNGDKASVDILWLKDVSLSDSDNPQAAEAIGQEIVADLKGALEQFTCLP